VVCDSDIAELSHKELFCLDDDLYVSLVAGNISASGNLLDTDRKGNFSAFYNTVLEILRLCNTDVHPSKIHLVLNWENLLQLAIWSIQSPAKTDIINILAAAGLDTNELEKIKSLDAKDMFAYLMHRKRFDIFRRICHSAKRRLRSHIADKSIQIVCYIVSPATKRIVASSL